MEQDPPATARRASGAGSRGPGAGTTGEAELRRRFTVRTETFAHAALRLEVLLPRSADALIDEAEFDADERLPYWADLWPAARALARYLADAPHLPRSALELGCGLGLPSLVLLARGVPVLATDYQADALRFARVNAARNGLPPLDARLLDWRAWPADAPRFELVLAADVAYERRNAAALAALLPHAVAPGGRFVLADPGRAYLEGFVDQMQQKGWQVRDRDRFCEPTGSQAGTHSNVRLVELRR